MALISRPHRLRNVMAAASVAVMASVGMVAAPAQADPVPIGSAPCDYDICFYADEDFRGDYYMANVRDNNCRELGGTTVNRVTSIVNKSNRAYYVYDGDDCRTLIGTVYARTANDAIGPGANNKINSFRRVP